MIVIRELEQLLFLPSTNEKAQYYAMITMNQTILTAKEKDVANKLIEIYFIFFKKLLKIQEKEDNSKKNEENEEVKVEEENDKKKSKKQMKKEKQQEQKKLELDDHKTKMIAAVLTGVNRAFHFAYISDKIVEDHL